VVASNSSQILVVQANGNRPCDPNCTNNQLTLTSLSVASNGALLQQDTYLSGQYGTDLTVLSPASLGGGNVAVYAPDDNGSPNINLWSVNSSGTITKLGTSRVSTTYARLPCRSRTWVDWHLAIDNAELTPNLYEVLLWGGTLGSGYQILANSTVGGCLDYGQNGNAAAASLEAEIVRATAGVDGGLSVEVWLYLP